MTKAAIMMARYNRSRGHTMLTLDRETCHLLLETRRLPSIQVEDRRKSTWLPSCVIETVTKKALTLPHSP